MSQHSIFPTLSRTNATPSGRALGGPSITHIPPDIITDLENYVVLPSGNAPSSAPPSPTLSPVQAPAAFLHVASDVSLERPFARATTMPATGFTHAFFRSKDGEVLRNTPAARAASLQAIVQNPTTQLRRRKIQMFLKMNAITRLPAELFRVSALAVLSLRAFFLVHDTLYEDIDRRIQLQTSWHPFLRRSSI